MEGGRGGGSAVRFSIGGSVCIVIECACVCVCM